MPRFHIVKAAASGSHPRAANAVVEEAGGCITQADIERIHKLFDPRPDCGELLRQSYIRNSRTWRDDLADDLRELVSEVRGSPYSHALTALGGLLAGLLLIIVPALIAARLS